MQKVTFNNGKLEVYADGVNILSKEESILLVGDFTIRADDVARLISLLDNRYFEVKSVYNKLKRTYETSANIVTENYTIKNLTEELDLQTKGIKMLDKDYGKALTKIELMQFEIANFNSLPWYKRILKKINCYAREI